MADDTSFASSLGQALRIAAGTLSPSVFTEQNAQDAAVKVNKQNAINAWIEEIQGRADRGIISQDVADTQIAALRGEPVPRTGLAGVPSPLTTTVPAAVAPAATVPAAVAPAATVPAAGAPAATVPAAKSPITSEMWARVAGNAKALEHFQNVESKWAAEQERVTKTAAGQKTAADAEKFSAAMTEADKITDPVKRAAAVRAAINAYGPASEKLAQYRADTPTANELLVDKRSRQAHVDAVRLRALEIANRKQHDQDILDGKLEVVAEKEAKSQQNVTELVNKIDSAIQMIDEEPHVVGAGWGTVSRVGEFVGSSLSGGGETPAANFEQRIKEIQSIYMDSKKGGLRLKSQADNVDKLVPGLGMLQNASTARNGLRQLREGLVRGSGIKDPKPDPNSRGVPESASPTAGWGKSEVVK
jgi:hypothetical protein